MTPVLVERRGRLGVITLNRPAVINALNLEMVGLIRSALEDWRDDAAVQTVLLTGTGERGFCAGGDIVAIYRDAREGGTATVTFWREEYLLDAMIARYPKPVVAVIHGIVLGGGIGLAAHASHRVVTEHSSIGMPETTIGFVPDVGGTYLLSRAPGELGTHLALTAGSVGPADAIAIGMADACVTDVPALVAALESSPPDDAIAVHSVDPGAATLLEARSWVDAAYSGDDVGRILERLDAAATEGARAAAAGIRRKSPTALAVTLASLRRARELPSLEAVLDQEFRVSVHSLDWPDLEEGIRAQVIDKDRQPAWRPPTIGAVHPATIEEAFAPLPDELGLAG